MSLFAPGSQIKCATACICEDLAKKAADSDQYRQALVSVMKINDFCEVCCCNLNPFAPAAVSNHSGWIFRAILALRLDSASWKSAVVHCRHRIGLDFVGQTPIFALVAELSFVILLATPCTALALSRPLLNFDFICCPGPVLALLFCASALSRPCCTCSGLEQAWLQFALFWPCAGPC